MKYKFILMGMLVILLSVSAVNAAELDNMTSDGDLLSLDINTDTNGEVSILDTSNENSSNLLCYMDEYAFDDVNIPDNLSANYCENFSLPINFTFTQVDDFWYGSSEYIGENTGIKVYIDNILFLDKCINGGQINYCGRYDVNTLNSSDIVVVSPSYDLWALNRNITLNINLTDKINVGEHDIKIILSQQIGINYCMPGHDEFYYIDSEFHSKLFVQNSNLYLKMNDTYSKENHVAPLIVNINNRYGKNISGIKLDYFKNNEYIGSAFSDECGNSILKYYIPKNATGTYNISVSINNLNCFDNNVSSKLIINNDIHTMFISKNLTMYYHDGSNFTAQLTELDGSIISKEKVIMEINGINYTRISDENGFFSLKINLNGGIYKIKLYHLKSNDYLPCSMINYVNVTRTINSQNLLKNYRDDSNQFYAEFYDKNGSIIQNITIKFTINGVEYKRSTDLWGKAYLDINLLPGNYSITIYNSYTNEYVQNQVTVKDSIHIYSEDLIKYYKDNTQFETYIYDDNFNDVPFWYFPEFNVTFNINGIFYEKVSAGSVYLDIDLTPGEYIITIDYKGYKKSNMITILPAQRLNESNNFIDIDDIAYPEDNETCGDDFNQDLDNEETLDNYVDDYTPDNDEEIGDVFLDVDLYNW